MAWRRPGDKPLSEPMMVSLLTHICVNRPQRVNTKQPGYVFFVWKYFTWKTPLWIQSTKMASALEMATCNIFSLTQTFVLVFGKSIWMMISRLLLIVSINPNNGLMPECPQVMIYPIMTGAYMNSSIHHLAEKRDFTASPAGHFMKIILVLAHLWLAGQNIDGYMRAGITYDLNIKGAVS